MPVRKKPNKSRLIAGSKRARPDNRLAELAEAQEILLPELAARIAALEHLLIEKGLCTYDDLRQARAFVDTKRTA
ncbi:MAG: hypothetical protein HY208_07625 [Nitrospirae bacterium]|nr:hypothetical protein [Nitrospirota bacterium]